MKAKTQIILSLLFLLLGLVVYHSALAELFSAVIGREGSSHGVFIPFISAYFIWQKREALGRIKWGLDYKGLILLITGLIPLVITIESFHIRILFFFAFLTGTVWTLFGSQFLKAVIFPLLFLVTMIPIPADFYIRLANLTRDITYSVSTWIISAMRLTFYQEGYVLHFPDTSLRVAISCSGIRYLVSFFVFSLAYAYLTRESTLSRSLVVLSCFPISLAASVMRLTSIYLGVYFISPKLGEHTPHVIISWAVFFTFLFLSLALDQYFIKRREERESREAGMHPKTEIREKPYRQKASINKKLTSMFRQDLQD